MSTSEQSNPLYPVFLKASALQFLIVGGGAVGLEKLYFLMKSSPEAKVHLVASEILPEIEEIAAHHPTVFLSKKAFENQDLENIDIIIIATDDIELNKEIRLQAKAQRILVNVADTPDLCDFYLGGVVTKGHLKIAISTNGKSPTFSKRFREVLEEVLPEDMNSLLLNLHQIRKQLKGGFAEKVKYLNDLTSSLLHDKPTKN